jgi:hypothetical protein
MPEETVMVSTCPLCLGPDEVPSMVTVEIDRIIPTGRAAILICRSCVGAVIRAGYRVEPELAEITALFERMQAKSTAALVPANYPCVKCGRARTETPAAGCSEPEYHEETGDDPSTD